MEKPLKKSHGKNFLLNGKEKSIIYERREKKLHAKGRDL
jgi:hypothetical protein